MLDDISNKNQQSTDICCFITQESGNVPSGVITIFCGILSHWPRRENQKLMVLCNRGHWAYEQFRNFQESGVIDLLLECPFLTLDDIKWKISHVIKPPLLSYILRGFCSLIRPLYALWEISQLINIFREHRIRHVFSHNGGYPGGDLNRLVVYAGMLARIKNNYMIIHNVPAPVPFWGTLRHAIMDKIVALATTKLFSVSRSCADTLQEQRKFNVPIEVIPNGISVNNSSNMSKSGLPPHMGTRQACNHVFGRIAS